MTFFFGKDFNPNSRLQALLALLVLGLLSSLQVGCSGPQSPWYRIKQTLLSFVPRSVDKALDSLSLKSLQSTTPLENSPQFNENIKEFSAPILASASQKSGIPLHDWNFYLSHQTTPNAFALPGGSIVLFSKLLLDSPQGEEVLGVLAHELGHVIARHGVSQTITRVGVWGALSVFLGDLSGLAGLAMEGAAQLGVLKFSRDAEREADEIGAALLIQNQISVRGLSRFFNQLQKEQTQNSPLGTSGSWAAKLLSTHPMSEERANRFEELEKKYPQHTWPAAQTQIYQSKIKPHLSKIRPLPEK